MTSNVIITTVIEMNFYLLDHEATFEDLERFNFANQKVGVIAHIENVDDEILLQQRGEKSRDETDYDELADLVIHENLSHVFEKLKI